MRFWEDDEGAEIDADHERLNTPSEAVLMHRTYNTYTEVMWIRGYPGAKVVSVVIPEVTVTGSGHTMPAVLKTLPVGWRDLATPETFSAAVARIVSTYESCGWKRKPTDVPAGDPWGTPSILDREADF